MRKNVLFLFLISTLTYLSFSKSYKITGTLLNNKESKYVYIYDVWGNFVQEKIDSALVKKGKFAFTYEDNKYEGLYHIGVNKEKSAPIVIAQENIGITAEGSGFKSSIKIQTSPANEAFKKYIEANQNFEKSFANINKEYQETVFPLQKTNPELYQQEHKRLIDQIQLSRTTYKQFLVGLKNHSNAYIQKIGDLLEITEYTGRLNYFSKNDFNDESLTKGDFIVRKVNLYFTFFTTLSPQTMQQEIEMILQISPLKSKARAVVFEALTRAAIPNDAKYAKSIVDVFEQEYTNTEYPKRIKQLIPRPAGVNEGDVAPEINLASVNGGKIALSSLRGKVVLLDFWASWCGPCRRENPNVVKLYNKYKDKGFTIYSVSLDKSKASWEKAIQKDGLSWENHVSELKHWSSSAARDYNVTGIPSTFLIDQNGIVVAKNLRGAALEKALEEIFNVK